MQRNQSTAQIALDTKYLSLDGAVYMYVINRWVLVRIDPVVSRLGGEIVSQYTMDTPIIGDNKERNRPSLDIATHT